MNRLRILGISVAVLLALLLAWLLRAFVYHYLVIPIQFLAWSLYVLYISLPHELLWAAFLILAYMAALFSVYRRPRSPEATQWRSSHYAEMRISQLARYISKRQRPFYRHRLKYVLTDLALQAITQRKRITSQEVRNLANHRELDAPPELNSYFKEGLMPWAYGSIQSPGLIQQLIQRRSKEKEADDLNMQVLKYIEEQMEIERDGNFPSL